MPESRDRLTRLYHDVAATYGQRRILHTSNRDRDVPVMFVIEDDDERTPFRWRGTTMVGTPRPIRIDITRGSFVTPRTGRLPPIVGLENLSPLAGRGHDRGSPLPSWYPRRPLNDITSVVRLSTRVNQRTRDPPTPRGGRILRIESPIIIRRQIFNDASASRFRTPRPEKLGSPSIDKVQKILLDVTQDNDGGDKDCNLTPQKKLLNSLDTVEKVVKEELRNLKRTPSAKRAEREKRVRTLMSMR